MNFSSLSTFDQRVLIAGAVAAIIAVISFLDPSGDWGAVMILSLLGGLGAIFVAIQPQVAPTAKLPTSKGISVLVAGVLAAGGSALAMLTYLDYLLHNLVDVFVILMIVGLLAGLYILWAGWTSYQAEQRTSAPPPPPPTTAA